MKDYPSYSFEKLVEIDFAEKDLVYFRKGKVGQWRSDFSRELSERIDEYLRVNLKYDKKLDFGDEHN